jgi:hypothetical protein
MCNRPQLAVPIGTHLPGEAAEALLNLATGVATATPSVVTVSDQFEHPDAQRRFRVMKNIEELQLALDYPWEKWAVFLHPAQRQLVERDFNGPAKVAGSAGTGKTIVALHRAVHLARANQDSRVLLTTFSDMLANALRTRLRLLIGSQPRLGEQIEVLSMKAVGLRLYELNLGKPTMASPEMIRRMMQESSDSVADHKSSLRFLLSEWEQVVDAWQLSSWEEYRDVTRLGRKTRLKEPQRSLLWSMFDDVRAQLHNNKLMTEAGMFDRLATHYSNGGYRPSTSRLSMRRRMSASLSFGFLHLSEASGVMVSSSPVTLDRESFSNPSHGKVSVSICGGGQRLLK